MHIPPDRGRRGIGAWAPPASARPRAGTAALHQAAARLGTPFVVVAHEGQIAVGDGGDVQLGRTPNDGEHEVLAWVPAMLPGQLGDAAFCEAYGLRAAYVAGEMANGIASEELVIAIARAGMLGVFGAAGLAPARVRAALERLEKELGKARAGGWGVNLIHSPDDARLEDELVTMFLAHDMRFVSASAFLDLTLPIVRYRVAGIHRDAEGTVVVPNRVMAKVSRVEVARKFLAPPPDEMLEALTRAGHITVEQAALARTVPMADDVTAEADSGGHTDNRPLVLLLPALQALRDELGLEHRFLVKPRVGAAGGLATPASVAAAFAMGAAYVVTGSINQACREAGTSDAVRQMLATCAPTDVAMAPAADMFEMGVEVQVLTRGTLFAVRARRLYELYQAHASIDALPASVRAELEKTYFKQTLEEAWESCRAFFAERDPRQIERALAEPKHKLALVFRSYLGQASRWANAGVADRRLDYQVWCGPAMGAFNAWTKGSFLEGWEARHAVVIAKNLMCGAAFLTRIAALRAQGIDLPSAVQRFAPREEALLEALATPPPAPAATSSATKHTRGREEPIAIVGLGGLYPNAENLHAFWRLLRTGKDAVTDVPASHWSLAEYYDADPKAPDKTYARRGAFLDPHAFDPTEFGIPPSILEATDTAQLLGLVAARMAIEDAGYGDGVEWDRSRASVLLGVTGTQELVIALGARLGHPKWRKALLDSGIDAATAEEVVQRISQSYVGWQESSFPGLLGNVVAGRIANRLDFGGTNCVIDAACASSLGAVHLAMLELRSGKSDLVLTGGVDALNDIFMHMCFSKTPALSASGDVRPFSDRADGTLLGEAMGMLVLKRLSDAERDGDRVYATIRGLGTSSDGRAKSIYAPLPSGQARALRTAYEEANVRPRDIDMLEAHGTGTKAGDLAEMEALTNVYRADSPDPAWCALGSVKSQVGHTKAAAGAVGITKAALALHHRMMLPTLKVDAPNPALKIAESPFTISTAARPWLKRESGPRLAAVSSFGFGGSNFHIVMEEHGPTRSEPAWDGAIELLALSAETADALRTKVEEASKLTRRALAAFAAKARADFRATAPHRLVAVLAEETSPQALLQPALAKLASSPGVAFSLPDGVHYGSGPASGKLAFVFPGQGAQHVDMLREVACVFPELRHAVEDAGAVAHAIYPAPTFDVAERTRREEHLRKTDVAQPALGAISRGLLAVLARFGVKPELAAGHSFGELSALHSAGVLDGPAFARVAALRGTLMAGDGGDRGSMMAVLAPIADIERAIAEEKLAVVLANRNGPAQGVLSGTREDLAKAEEVCKARGLRTTRLSVGAAFHSPLVAGAASAFRAGLSEVPFDAPAFAVVAGSNAEPYPHDPNAARDLLGEQLAVPVRFDDVVEKLYASGVRTFLEVGPRTALTGMVKATLGARDHAAIALDAQRKHGGLFDLAQALGRIAALGHAVDLGPWQRVSPPPRATTKPPRTPKMTVPLTGANYRNPVTPIAPKAHAPAAHANGTHASNGHPAVNGHASNGHASNGTNPNANGRPTSRLTQAAPHEPSHGNRIMQKPLVGPALVQAPAAHAQPSSVVVDLLRANQEALRALQAQQEQTARVHQLFLEGQQQAQASFYALLTGQNQLSQMALTGALPSAPAPYAAPAFAPPAYVAPVQAPVPVQIPAPTYAPAPAYAAPQPTYAAPAATQAVPVPAPVVSPPSAAVDVVSTLLDVIVQTTGYPREILVLTMEMEADLGIDSIKRVEILSLLSKRIPGAPSVNPEKLGTLKTLQNVVDFIGVTTGANGAAAPSTILSDAPGAGARQAEALVTRHVVVPVRLDLRRADTPLTFPEDEILVTPDTAGLAEALVREWTRLGARARIVADPAAITGPIGGLVLLPPEGDGWSARDEDVLKSALRLARTFGPRLVDAATRGSAMFASVSRRDGAFGHASTAGIGSALAGGLAGLVKTAAHEWPNVTTVALDVSATLSIADAARAIVNELGVPAGDGVHEIGIGPADRITLALREEAAVVRAGRLQRGDLVVVTGGARGVTADCARALAEATGVSLLLLGRSPLADEPAWIARATDEASVKRALLENADPSNKPTPKMIGESCRAVFAGREIRANLAALEALGVRAQYAAVDIRDAAAVARVLDDARASMGPLRGILHGAGVLRDKRIADKSDEDLAEVIDTKLAGLRTLLGATGKDDLRFLALFASVSGRFGRRGQSDYALANQALVSIAQDEAGKRPETRVVALDWGPWDGGMVTPALKAEFQREGVGLIPLAEGARALVTEAQTAPGGPTEVVLGVGGFGAFPASFVADRWTLASVHDLDPKTDPVLVDHQLAGKAVLPFARALEWLARASGGDLPSVLEDARVLRPLRVDARTQMLVWAGPVSGKRIPLELRNTKDEVLVRAHARTDGASDVAPSPLPSPAGLAKYAHTIDAAYGSLLFHGPALRMIASVSGISAEGMTLDLRTDTLPVDGIFQALILWCRELRGAPSLPSHVARLTQYRSFDRSGSVRAIVRIKETEGAVVTSDVDLVDEGGVVLRLEGYSCTVSATLDRAFRPEELRA